MARCYKQIIKVKIQKKKRKKKRKNFTQTARLSLATRASRYNNRGSRINCFIWRDNLLKPTMTNMGAQARQGVSRGQHRPVDTNMAGDWLPCWARITRVLCRQRGVRVNHIRDMRAAASWAQFGTRIAGCLACLVLVKGCLTPLPAFCNLIM